MAAGWIMAGSWADHARSLKSEGWRLVDLAGLDRLGLDQGPRFEVVAQLRHPSKELKTLHVVAQGDPPAVPSVTRTWPTAAMMEREAYDMFGIIFDGHPNLKRLLMPDDWEGHPLRKDYGVGKVPVEFVPQPFLQIDTPGQGTEPDEAEHGVDHLGQAGPPQREWTGVAGETERRTEEAGRGEQ